MDNIGRDTHRTGILYSTPMCIFLFLFCFPVGLILIFTRLFRSGKISRGAKNAATVATIVLTIVMFIVVGGANVDSMQEPDQRDIGSATEQDSTDEPVQQIHTSPTDTETDVSTPKDLNLPTPTRFGRSDFSTISAGDAFSMVIDENGTLWGWGHNFHGELGVGYGNNSKYINQVHSFVDDSELSMRSDNIYEYYDRPIAIMEDVVAVDTGVSPLFMASGGGTTLALKKDGTLWGWGYNGECRLGSVSFSENEKIQYTPIMLLDRVVSMSIGRSTACAIRTDHKLWAWGNDSLSGTPKIVAEDVISACVVYKEITFIKEDQTLWSISDLNSSSAKYIADHVIAASPVDGGIIYLTSDGILYGLGYNTTYLFANNETGNVNTPVVIMEDIASFSVVTNTGSDFAVAISSDGTLYGWGCNNSGQLGNDGKGDMKDALGNIICTTPTVIEHNVAAASCGLDYTLILKSNGELYACGTNALGRLGIGEETGNRYNEELDMYSQTIPIKVMDGLMMPEDNSQLYDNGPVYSIWEGTYYGKKSDFKDYTMEISYGMNDGQLICIVSAEDDTMHGDPDAYPMQIDSNNRNCAYSSSLRLDFNNSYIDVTAKNSTTPHSRYYKTKAEREASATETLNLDDLLGTWVFRAKLFGILNIFKEKDTYYLNFYYTHSGPPGGDAYLRVPVQLTSQDGIAIAKYTDDNCGNSGTIRILRDAYGKYFLSGSVDGMDDAVAEEYKNAQELPALVVSNEEMRRDDDVKTWTVFKFIDPSAAPQRKNSTDIDFLLNKIFYNISDSSEYLEFTMQNDQIVSFNINQEYQGSVSLYDMEISDDFVGIYYLDDTNGKYVAINIYYLYDGTCYVETSDGRYDGTAFQ